MKEEARTLDFSPQEWMLILLGADNFSPIKGKTVFVKQLFVIGKELFPDLDRDFKFYPHRYGPYSGVFEQNLRALVEAGLVDETSNFIYTDTSPEKRRSDFRLLPPGKQCASSLLGRLPQAPRMELEKQKRVMSRMGFWGLIHYVYSNYPRYSVASEIGMTKEA